MVYGWHVLAMLIVALAGCAGNQTPVPTATPTAIPTLVRSQPRRVSAVELSPTATPPLNQAPTALAPTERPDASVRYSDSSLYGYPGGGGNVIHVLPAALSLTVIGRMDDNQWLQVVTPDAQVGWVRRDALNVYIDLEAISVTAFVGQAQPTSAPVPVASGSIITGITRRSREIFEQGQQRGNRANVFSKVGDSLTVATFVLHPIGWGRYNLREYGYLEPVVRYFSTENARTANAFANISLAADNSWTTEDILNPAAANPAFCQSGETPLACEYRLVQPALALILVGTNDAAEIAVSVYRENMRQIIDVTINNGIIPVVSTIPDRPGFENQVVQFNAIVRDLAREYDIPLWDYGRAMRLLPNNGLSDDGVHPSWPSGDVIVAADFTARNLQYGYTLRNLTALQVLDALWRQIIKG